MRCSLIIEKFVSIEKLKTGDAAIEQETGYSKGAAPARQGIEGGKRRQKAGGYELMTKIESKIR